MNRRLGVVGLAAIAGWSIAAAASASTNLVSDGDFSSPYGGVYSTYFSNGGGSGSSFGAWTVTSGSVDLIGTYWQSPSGPGGGSVDLDGDTPGAISQNLSLIAGSYVLSFDLSGNPDGAPTVKTVDVTVGSANQSYTYTIGTNTHANMSYTVETLDFTATGPTALTFTSQDQNSPYGPVIGAVEVTAVPEASTWALMLVGFATIGFALRRGWALKRELAALQSV